MYIGKKDGNIIVFNGTLKDLEINASVRGIVLDSVEQTDEEIVPYYNTINDGYYFKKSEVPTAPAAIANEAAKLTREWLYGEQSDPITNHIAVLRDRIEQGDYEDDDEKLQISERIADLYMERKQAREKIESENPYV